MGRGARTLLVRFLGSIALYMRFPPREPSWPITELAVALAELGSVGEGEGDEDDEVNGADHADAPPFRFCLLGTSTKHGCGCAVIPEVKQ